MTMFEAMEARHAVRSYQDKKIENVIVDALKKEIATATRREGYPYS